MRCSTHGRRASVRLRRGKNAPLHAHLPHAYGHAADIFAQKKIRTFPSNFPLLPADRSADSFHALRPRFSRGRSVPFRIKTGVRTLPPPPAVAHGAARRQTVIHCAPPRSVSRDSSSAFRVRPQAPLAACRRISHRSPRCSPRPLSTDPYRL